MSVSSNVVLPDATGPTIAHVSPKRTVHVKLRIATIPPGWSTVTFSSTNPSFAMGVTAVDRAIDGPRFELAPIVNQMHIIVFCQPYGVGLPITADSLHLGNTRTTVP